MKTRALLLLASGLTFGTLQAKELSGAYTPTSEICPSPEEARAKMTVPEGYEVRCFAHEPMVQNPVAMTWDHRGRLWVVEAYEYPNGSEHPAPFGGVAQDDQYHPLPKTTGPIPRDRVVILEDTDNDGVADKRSVFVEGLNLASAILCGDNGIYVGQQPHLLHFRDDDGDDQPDAWRVCLTGFGREDTHELVNSFTWGPDGWLYMTHGVFTNSKVRRPGQPEKEGFKFDAGIGRARPMSREKEAKWEFEVFADGTSNPWGCDYDAAGNFFVSACVIDHFFHMAPGGIYVRQGGAPENPYAYEQLPSIVKHKHFRAAYAGVQIYQGGRYPEDTWGHAFIGNIHDNAIHEEVLTPVGATFKCEPRRDFLRANDGWFRPVSTQTGPDGFLWVMDWCDKYPCYQNAKANPEGVDRDRGRIWRVVVKDDKSKTTRERTDLNLKKRTTPELVTTLEHPNNWMRRMARRMLVEKEDSSSLPTLRSNLAAKNSIIRAESFWTLISSSSASIDDLGSLTKNADNTLRKWAAFHLGQAIRIPPSSILKQNKELDADIQRLDADKRKEALGTLQRITEGQVPEQIDGLIWQYSGDENLGVRYHAAIAQRRLLAGSLTTHTRQIKEQPSKELAQRMLLPARAINDPLMVFGAWSLMETGFNRFPELLLTEAGKMVSHSTLIKNAMRRLCDTRKAENLDLAVAFCDKIAAHDILLAPSLDGLVKGQESGVIKPTKDVSASLAKWRTHTNADVRKHGQTLAVLWGDDTAVKEMIVTLHDAKKPEKERIAVLQSLRKVKTDTVKEGLKPLLTPQISTALAVSAIRAAADLGGDDFIAPLLQQAASKAFNVRIAALEALSNRTTWTQAMLTAIAEGKVSPTGFPAPVRRALATSKDKAIRDQAFKVLGAWKDSSDDVKALIAAKKKACLTGTPDLANGKTMFQATCMVCHEFHGGGQKVGPDLIGSGRSNLDALLANVIDPNQIIGNGYENIIVATKDGRTLAGRLVEDSPGHVKMLGAGGAAQIVPRDQVASITNTKQSLMPMGFGALPDEMFRDLIWYILAPPEEGPLTKEKKDLLIRGVETPPTTTTTKPRTNWRAIDWESVSLWNPDWKVTAPEFERTPVKLADYYGRSNVLLLHPFEDKKTLASIERTFKVEASQPKLHFAVAADDRGDWQLKVTVNGQRVREMNVDHEKPRWKEVEVDLTTYAGQEITVRLETHATDWYFEFAYWHGITMKE